MIDTPPHPPTPHPTDSISSQNNQNDQKSTPNFNLNDEHLAAYAQRAYLEYALSVVKGRALPDVGDGQKPVQRRILYAMYRMGLGWNQTGQATKPVKSARVVGDVLGRFHPHGDQAAYDALVRMAQDFTQRYPLIDGQGNFGSRDGDGAAAMRYTEARLSKITTLILDEMDLGTVDFVPNYDGSTEEPVQLPARLPFSLLNGASGIAVGMATEIPSHNLREIAKACGLLLRDPSASDEALAECLPGPDFPGGGHIISSTQEIQAAYRTGRGSLKVRCKGGIEELARHQWQWVVTELPPNVSSQRILEEIEELSNPKIKAGKKTLTQDQTQLKATLLAVLDGVRDESSKDAPVRLVFEPKSSRIVVDDLVTVLLAHTSLETSVSINLTAIGLDGKPCQKNLRQLLEEWVQFRQQTVFRRSQFQLQKIQDRIHLLEGRQMVLLHLDEVIAIIRQSDTPKADLQQRFALSDRQAEDILEIRLRQLARLEALRIEQELSELHPQKQQLQALVADPEKLKQCVIKEIETDAKTFGDARRTLIAHEQKTVIDVRMVDEPITVVVSSKAWVRARTGHGHDVTSFQFKAGDGLHGVFECRSVDTLLMWGDQGRVYSVPVASLPGGRGDGAPMSSLVDLETGIINTHFYAGAPRTVLLLAGQEGYGFLATVESMSSRQKAGKAFVNLNQGEIMCSPQVLDPHEINRQIFCLTEQGRVLSFAANELRFLDKGGRGLQLIKLEDGDRLVHWVSYLPHQRVVLEGVGRGGKLRTEVLTPNSLATTKALRGRKGKVIHLTFKVSRVGVETI